ncbi:MAG: SsrA-binding protein SmpB [Buchnera aphidicola (Microlophium carnosum)]|uniref:SsrA-binding protein n=1 Tax=Buchnera aphidicola (Microlophium carnosum) TaxID=2708354 RepID=A0A6G9JV12_9GAMM|nr:MAG: SsrA-binding protein SmpB [Buchnera aphidicola (Microlophium carnosum)]
MLHKKKYDKKSSKIVVNKKAYHNYFIEKVFHSGLVLEGWEIKSIRSGKVNISDSYIISHLNEMYLCNSLIQPLPMSSNHIICNPIRRRKLLLHKDEINFLSFQKKNIGCTMVSLSLFWKKSWCKLEFGLAKGKTVHDKRTNLKTREWNKERLKILKKTKSIY